MLCFRRRSSSYPAIGLTCEAHGYLLMNGSYREVTIRSQARTAIIVSLSVATLALVFFLLSLGSVWFVQGQQFWPFTPLHGGADNAGNFICNAGNFTGGDGNFTGSCNITGSAGNFTDSAGNSSDITGMFSTSAGNSGADLIVTNATNNGTNTTQTPEHDWVALRVLEIVLGVGVWGCMVPFTCLCRLALVTECYLCYCRYLFRTSLLAAGAGVCTLTYCFLQPKKVLFGDLVGLSVSSLLLFASFFCFAALSIMHTICQITARGDSLVKTLLGKLKKLVNKENNIRRGYASLS